MHFLISVFTVMDNYKNVPECLYGLTHQQMNMFMEKDNILTRQAANVTLVSNSNFVCTFCSQSIRVARKKI